MQNKVGMRGSGGTGNVGKRPRRRIIAGLIGMRGVLQPAPCVANEHDAADNSGGKGQRNAAHRRTGHRARHGRLACAQWKGGCNAATWKGARAGAFVHRAAVAIQQNFRAMVCICENACDAAAAGRH